MDCPSCGQENFDGAKFCNECGVSLGTPAEDKVTSLEPREPTPPITEVQAAPQEVPSMSILTSGTFVGRGREMAELVTALDDALAGHGRLVMLVGEPGIGKTSLARELSEYAEQRSAQVLWGRCYEGEGAPPYWPWVQSIRAYIQQKDIRQLHDDMGPGASDIAEIVTELREKLPDLEPSPPLEPDSARFRLFDSITTFFKRASQRQPLLLILDDLHWADKSTLLLLEFFAQEVETSHLMVLGAYRAVDASRQGPLYQALGNLVRERSFQRLQLRGLSPQEVRQFAETITGTTVSADLVEAVHARTEGNPLFVKEVVRLNAQEGLERSQEIGIRIPEGVRDVIGKRLNLLSVGCNHVLTIASVIGQEFVFELLHRLTDDLNQEELLHLLEEGLRAGIIEEAPDAVGTYQFSHALVQDTLASELSLTRRVRLHGRIAEILEDLHAEDMEDHASELAYHFVQAEAVHGSEKVVEYSKMAGEQSLLAHAYEEALLHFQRAITAWGSQSSTIQTADIFLGLGRAQAATLQVEEARENLRNAFSSYVELGEIDSAVRVVESIPPGMGLIGMDQLIADALALVPPTSLQAGRLLVRYGNDIALHRGDFEAARAALQKALEISRLEGDRALEMRTLTSMASAYAWQLRFGEALDISLAAIDLSSECNELYSETLARMWAGLSLAALGELDKAKLQAKAGLGLSERLRNRWMRANLLDVNHALARYSGHWKEAYEFGDLGLKVSPYDSRLLGDQAIIAFELGDFAKGDAYLDRLLQTVHGAKQWPWYFIQSYIAANFPIRAWISGDNSRLNLAESTARELLSSPSAIPLMAFGAWTGLALIAVKRDDVESSRECYEALDSMRHTHWWIQGDRILGLLAQTMSNFDDSEIHFEEALTFCRNGGYRPQLAWSLHDYANWLLERNNVGDREKALEMLGESLALSTELGMKPVIARVTDLKEKASMQLARPPAYPDGLTRREAEVLRLIASGQSNREIAETLFISYNTAINHVKNILGKTNSANRTEAAAYAIERGLTSRD